MMLSHTSLLLSGQRASGFYGEVSHLPTIARVSRRTLHELAENKSIQTPAQLWLSDPARQALMRRAGTQELFVTGDSSDYESFRAFAVVIQDMAPGNTRLQCHAELQRFFDCSLVLCDTHCDRIWKQVSAQLCTQRVTWTDLYARAGVQAFLCAADPTDDLEDFVRVKGALPVFCPDVYLQPNGKDFAAAVRRLCGEETGYTAFLAALSAALDRFVACSCRAAVLSVLPNAFCRPDEYHAALFFEKAMRGETLAKEEVALFQAQMLRFLGREYVRRAMVLEIPTGGAHPMENIEKIDTVCGDISAKVLRELLDYLKDCNGFPRTVFYPSTPHEARELAYLAGHYPALCEDVPQCRFGIALGTPSEDRATLQALASVLPLSHVVGTFADLRAPLSPLDADLFRRSLCTLLAKWEDYGELELTDERIGALLRGVCYENAQRLYRI